MLIQVKGLNKVSHGSINVLRDIRIRALVGCMFVITELLRRLPLLVLDKLALGLSRILWIANRRGREVAM